MFDRCAVGHLPFSKKMYLPLVGNGSPTMRSMYPPLVGLKSFLRCKKLIWTYIYLYLNFVEIIRTFVTFLYIFKLKCLRNELFEGICPM